MARTHGKVIDIVRGSHLDHACSKCEVHVVVRNDRDLPVAKWQVHAFSDERFVALVLGIDHDGDVTQERFWPGGGHYQAFARTHHGVSDKPQRALFFVAFDLQIGDGGFENRVPIDQTLATVNQPLLVKPHEGFAHHLAQMVVHGEVFARPVHAVTHAAHLLGDGFTAFFFPLPNFVREHAS